MKRKTYRIRVGGIIEKTACVRDGRERKTRQIVCTYHEPFPLCTVGGTDLETKTEKIDYRIRVGKVGTREKKGAACVREVKNKRL